MSEEIKDPQTSPAVEPPKKKLFLGKTISMANYQPDHAEMDSLARQWRDELAEEIRQRQQKKQ